MNSFLFECVRIHVSPAGQERFRTISPQHYRGAHGALLVYDIADASTFDSVESWLQELRSAQVDPNIVLLLVGNKSDLEHIREVSVQEGLKMAEREGMLFTETSALDSSNVNEAFELVVKEIMRRNTQAQLSRSVGGSSLVLGSGENLKLDMNEKGRDKNGKRGKTCC